LTRYRAPLRPPDVLSYYSLDAAMHVFVEETRPPYAKRETAVPAVPTIKRISRSPFFMVQ